MVCNGEYAPLCSIKYFVMQDVTKLKIQYYIGYILTIIVGVLLTLPYCIAIAIIRLTMCLFDIIGDTFTFMPRALYEFQKAFQKRIGQIRKD